MCGRCLRRTREPQEAQHGAEEETRPYTGVAAFNRGEAINQQLCVVINDGDLLISTSAIWPVC